MGHGVSIICLSYIVTAEGHLIKLPNCPPYPSTYDRMSHSIGLFVTAQWGRLKFLYACAKGKI